MTVEVLTKVEQRRGCGWRKPGGLYLVSDGIGAPCEMVPFRLEVCPTCHAGIKPSRGWTQVDIDALMHPGPHGCRLSCPFNAPIGRGGLLWIGDAYYTPGTWTREALTQGVSRRLAAVPTSLELGKTWVIVAHRKAVPREEGDRIADAGSLNVECVGCQKRISGPGVLGKRGTPDAGMWWHPAGDCGGAPGVFHAFKPARVEYVVKGDETEDELERMADRGITLVRVEKAPGVPVTDDDDLDQD